MDLKAVVIAGGEGTRLRPLTSNQPKPMVPVFNKPVMEYALDLLKKHSVTDVVITLQFLPQLIKNYFGEGNDLGMNLNYSIEEEPLGTAGSVKKAEEYLRDDTFVVLSGDVITDFDLTALINFHTEKKALATLALVHSQNPLEFGIVIIDEEHRVQRFLEKPTWGQVFSDTINTGVYVLEPEVLKLIPTDRPFDFSKELFPLILESGEPLFGYVAEGYWSDIGNFEQYLDTHHDLLEGKARIEPPGIKMSGDIWIGEGAVIHPKAELKGPVFVGQYARVESGAQLGTHTVVGNNVVLMDNSHVERSIIWDNSYIGGQTRIHRAVVGKKCDIKNGARLEQGVVVGDECIVGENSVINHNVKVYPFKRIEPGAVVNKSIIWESRGMQTLFGQEGVNGLINVDITPDLAMRLAMAYATGLEKGASVVTSRDTSRASRLVKRAMIAGLNTSGVNCQDLRVAPTPINRFNIISARCAGGIHVRVASHDPQSLEIKFFDSQGIDINAGEQRSIERYFFREDFRRAFYTELGEIVFPARMLEFYTNGLLRIADKEIIREAKFRLVIDCAFTSAALIMPNIIGKLGAEMILLNATTDETKVGLTPEEFSRATEELSRTVKLFSADLGVLITDGCEGLRIVDENGQQISTNDALHLMVSLIGRFESKKGRMVVPLTASRVVEEIASAHGRKVKRTKLSSQALMEATLHRDTAFAGTQTGSYIFPQFLPAFDSIMSFCKLLEYLARSKSSMSELHAALPRYHMANRDVYCPWDRKGQVMRRLVEKFKDHEMDLTDGIKIFEQQDSGTWFLVLPDAEEPVVHLFVEADTRRDTEEKMAGHVDFLKAMLG